MKNNLYTIALYTCSSLLLFCLWSDSFGQAAFEPGRSTYCLGLGQLPYQLDTVFDSPPVGGDTYYKKKFGSFVFKYEYALTRNIGVGLGISYAIAKGHMYYNPPQSSSSSVSGDYNYSNWGFAPRVNCHLGQNIKIDPYFGLGADIHRETYRLRNSSDSPEDKKPVNLTNYKIGYEAVIGVKLLMGNYFKNFGAFVEVGKTRNGFIQYGFVVRI